MIKMMMKKIIIFTIIFLNSGCHQSENKATQLVSSSLSKNRDAKVQSLKMQNIVIKTKIKKSAIEVLSPYRRVEGTFEHTSFVGTLDHPTIDGGIINSNDGIPLSYDVPVAAPVVGKEMLAKPAMNIQRPFQDNWVKDERVKKLLIEAATQGKLNYVIKKADEMGMPSSVAVVPMVESHYQTTAISSKGAAGAWQLMPSVAKAHGIQDQERFQFVASTDVALKLLSELHQQFGNWELAFAAYNAGSKRVQDAMQKNPNAMTVNDLDLPEETKTYVKKIAGLNEAIRELSINGV